jgi:hypothetical protein
MRYQYESLMTLFSIHRFNIHQIQETLWIPLAFLDWDYSIKHNDKVFTLIIRPSLLLLQRRFEQQLYAMLFGKMR